MFRSTARNLRSWRTDFSDDILGADLPSTLDDTAPDPLEYHLNHSHRRPLGTARPRREGAVPARPAHCLSPVRADSPVAADPERGSRQLSH
jgi:hypothetical protein